ncbi:MAG: hypothetical protein LBE08_02935 [Bifidobacteriaceae bacterium]|nr:hypothetical protein [Bifidobacteriaceae bacterium]
MLIQNSPKAFGIRLVTSRAKPDGRVYEIGNSRVSVAQREIPIWSHGRTLS